MEPAAEEETVPLMQAPKQERLEAKPEEHHQRDASSSTAQEHGGDDRVCRLQEPKQVVQNPTWGQVQLLRICFEGSHTHDDPLISPCLCSGGSRYVHRQCLQQWRESCRDTSRSKAFYRCEVCHYEYQYRRLDNAALLAHPVVVPLAFALLLAAATGLLGFIPLIQACIGDYELHGAVHVLVHFTDGLVLLGLVGFVLFLIYGERSRGSSGLFDACPACCYCPDCTAFASADCGAAAGAAGELCGVMMLVVLLLVAVLGLLYAIPTTLAWMYQKVDDLAGATVQMVENVSAPKSQLKKQPAAEAITAQEGSQQNSQQQLQQQQHGAHNAGCAAGADAV